MVVVDSGQSYTQESLEGGTEPWILRKKIEISIKHSVKYENFFGFSLFFDKIEHLKEA